MNSSPGKFIAINASMLTNLSAIFNAQLISGVAGESKESIERLKNLTVQGDFKAFIDRIHPLEDFIEAHQHVDSSHKKGNVVISVLPEETPSRKSKRQALSKTSISR